MELESWGLEKYFSEDSCVLVLKNSDLDLFSWLVGSCQVGAFLLLVDLKNTFYCLSVLQVDEEVLGFSTKVERVCSDVAIVHVCWLALCALSLVDLLGNL